MRYQLNSELQMEMSIMQGIVLALILLDTYPINEIKTAPASHALHCCLEATLEKGQSHLNDLENHLTEQPKMGQ